MAADVVVGLSGATGAAYAVRLLTRLRELGVRSHLVATPAGLLTAHHELGLERRALEALADEAYGINEVGARIASGSFAVQAMLVAPCSMRTLAAVAHGLGDNLLTRAADVTLKERRRLVLATREAPLNLAHLRNMVAATEMGAVICPPLPAFYLKPTSVEAIVAEGAERLLGLAGVPGAAPTPWQGC
ncbi:MAG: UbiX family flavin prenyltransferase [Proteobacteria bacterium]|nr:UbiX family flavin prenyltransferase [Pseudomonadota bacterium]